MLQRSMIENKILELEEDLIFLEEGVRGYDSAIKEIIFPYSKQERVCVGYRGHYGGGSIMTFINTISASGQPEFEWVKKYYYDGKLLDNKEEYIRIKEEKILQKSELDKTITELDEIIKHKRIALDRLKVDLEMVIEIPEKDIQDESIDISKSISENLELAKQKLNENLKFDDSKKKISKTNYIIQFVKSKGCKERQNNPGIQDYYAIIAEGMLRKYGPIKGKKGPKNNEESLKDYIKYIRKTLCDRDFTGSWEGK